MCSQSVLKTVALAVIATFTLLATAESKVSAQEIFGGRGISGLVDGSSPSFSNPLGSQFETQSTNPIAGIFKKPAFLENLKVPTIQFKKPSFDLINSAGNGQASGAGFLSNLPKLGNLFPQRQPGQQSMLSKMKAKTDAFFAKASIFENLIPGRQPAPQAEPGWNDVRRSMEQIMAAQAAEPTSRSASAIGNTLRR